MKKILKSRIFWVIITAIICVTGTVYAISANEITYGNTTVDLALDDLYNKVNTEFSYIEKIYQTNFSSLNYTYTVNTDGIYLVVTKNSNPSCDSGTITTTATEIVSEALGSSNGGSLLKIVNATAGDTININVYSRDDTYKGNVIIAKLHGINVSEIINTNFTNDSTASVTYTASTNNDKVLAVSIGNSINKSASITYSGNHSVSILNDDAISISYARLQANTSLTASAYGYNWGGGAVYIIK